MKILACIDGSRTTKYALKYIGVLARKPSAEVTLLHVKRCDLCRVFPVIKDSLMRRKELDSDHILKEGVKILKEYGVGAKTKKAAGEVIPEITEEAQKGGYDLIVIGSQGVKGIEMFFFGATSYKLIEGIKKPILVVRKGRKGIYKVMACTGGSSQAKKALGFAIDVVQATNAKLTLLHVTKPESMGKSNYEKILEDALSVLKEKGVEAETTILSGEPAKKIVETARKGNYDLIVLGETSMNPVKMLFSGSVVYEVLTKTKVPCLIVK